MTTFGDMVYGLGGVPLMAGVPFGPKSKYYFVDPVNGSDSNDGTSPTHPKASILAAEALCVANQHDTVFFIAGATADDPGEQVVWDKDYTHLIGVGSYLPGLGQRCRVVHAAATALATPVVAFSGDGCVIKNMQFGNEYATGAMGVVSHTGQRCLFENVFFMVPFGVTAASYSLKLSGGENVFKRCTIGQQTGVRTGASRNLWIYEGDGDNQRNKFIECEFLSWSTATTHVLVYTDVDIENEGFVVFFENCLFDNLMPAAGTKLAVAIDDNCATADHQIVFRGRDNMTIGCTAVADPLTYTFAPDADDAVSGLLAIAVVES